MPQAYYVINSDSKDVCVVTHTKTFFLNKCCSFDFSIHQRILKKGYRGLYKKCIAFTNIGTCYNIYIYIY